ncbi:hypothetical protein [Citrobacter farmeri]|uniref:hypothetical protein n=1 Tax=Citrobacter farmeri TaxID=67824 RepID=UPI001900226C|nr:hypothetical protein [Citrobacter farmeri]MBJ9134442.1 hypothetical protein [Citrobacter farmeri]
MLSILNIKSLVVSLAIGFVIGVLFGAKVFADDPKSEIKQEAQQARETIKELDESETKTKVIIKEVPKIVERPIYTNICIDEDGLDVLRKLKESHK